jgi:hypothetical protein
MTKIEIDIPDIERSEVVDALASKLLHRWSADDDGEGHCVDSSLGKAMQKALTARIDAIAAEVVRRHLDDAIHSRIAAAVDAVITEGWYESDGYGGRKGERIDLKARINKALTEPRRGDGGYNNKPSILQERLDKAAESMLDAEFKTVVEQAKTKLRAQLDGAVMAKVATSIKEALGLR